MDDGVVRVVELLPSNPETLSSNPSTTIRKKGFFYIMAYSIKDFRQLTILLRILKKKKKKD
jgi:hypothetical protein